MKAFGKTVGKTVVFCLVMMLMCSFVYPLALTGVSQLTMKAKADGSKVDKDGNLTTDTKEAVGSALIGQDFTEDCYFQGRVSAVNYNTYTEEQKESGEYAGVASGSYNYANSNPELKERMEKELPVPVWIHISVRNLQRFRSRQWQRIPDSLRRK